MREETVVIDTNVFEHWFNPVWNGDSHVGRLLDGLVAQKRRLCVDAGKRIYAEYEHRLDHYRNHPERTRFLLQLRGLMTIVPHETVAVDHGDGLAKCLGATMDKAGAEPSDKVFVYVACASDSLLISNNHSHINNHAKALKKCAKTHRETAPEFLDSKQVAAQMP